MMMANADSHAVPRSRYVLFALLSVGGCGVDLATKHWIFARLGFPARQPIWLVDDVLSLETSLNEGALFGIGQGLVALFATLSILAAVWIVYWLFVRRAARDLLLTLALACIMAGIFGNLYDRLGLPGMTWPDHPVTQRSGHAVGDPVYAVRDWIHFQYKSFDWPVFNIADSLLVCGAALLAAQSFRSEPTAQPASQVAKSGV
jgi:signal peptidase II